MSHLRFRLLVLSQLMIVASTAAQADVPQLYHIFPTSTLRHDVCVGPCDCLPHFFTGALRGSFFLTPDHSDPLFDYYRVTEINWAGNPDPTPIHLTGVGAYRIGGEFALMHQMELNLSVNGEVDVHGDSGLVPVDHQAPFPFIGIQIVTDIYGCNQLTINLETGPDRCPADLDHDGGSTLDDLAILLSHFGTHDGAVHEDGDIDGDGDVDLGDLTRLLARFGTSCPP